ncbi:MAG: PD-(D/E)XK nuclease family protein, partial [Marinilabiliales bacterium]|nr:PD-(D/E)XK nuclease family protein [Marinilabiliales bacterium]
MAKVKDSFLREIAAQLYGRYGQGISRLTLIFPNRRTSIFFAEYLNEIISRPLFAPEVWTIQDLFSKLSDLHLEDSLQLVIRLFKIYRKISGSEESFDDFYLWGEMLLQDFDQVDKYMVNSKEIFTSVTELSEIDHFFQDLTDEKRAEMLQFWRTLDKNCRKEGEKEFIRLWQILLPVYEQFRKELTMLGKAYEGMLYRDAVENGLNSSILTDNEFVMVGFNALNQCEKNLFQKLKLQGKASFYWDYDEYYVRNPNQEAGLFMRENLQRFPQESWPYSVQSFSNDRNYQIIHTSSQIGQANVVSKLLTNLPLDQAKFDDTAVVLCDEELLLPVLSAIPSELGSVNVTMGLPLRQTPLFSLINSLILLQLRCSKEFPEPSFHHKNVVDILNNQFIKSIYLSESELIIEKISKHNLAFVGKGMLQSNKLFCLIFDTREEVKDYHDYFQFVLHELFRLWEVHDAKSASVAYQEYIYQVYLALNKLNRSLFTKSDDHLGLDEMISKELYMRLLSQYLHSMTVAFEGEPLSGIQVMGILETRNLDFRNLVLLSVNEGIMPRANVGGSFIPYRLRKAVGLPSMEEQNAMYAYYFYRLIQRAEHVTFVYNSGSNGLKTGEKSRFLHQLLFESDATITEAGFQDGIDPLMPFPIVMEKRGEVAAKLDLFLEGKRHLSPTAMDHYLTCPLRFYFDYIAGFKENETVSEEVDARSFGKIFHHVLERIYAPYVGRVVDSQTLHSVSSNEPNLDKLLEEAFQIHFFKKTEGDPPFYLAGRNRLIFEVIKRMVIQTLVTDSRRTPFQILAVEKSVEMEIPIFGATSKIKIKGVIDRVDEKDGAIEIIDYKTGNSDDSF